MKIRSFKRSLYRNKILFTVIIGLIAMFAICYFMMNIEPLILKLLILVYMFIGLPIFSIMELRSSPKHLKLSSAIVTIFASCMLYALTLWWFFSPIPGFIFMGLMIIGGITGAIRDETSKHREAILRLRHTQALGA